MNFFFRGKVRCSLYSRSAAFVSDPHPRHFTLFCDKWKYHATLQIRRLNYAKSNYMYERDLGWGRLLSISSIIGSQRLKDDQRTSVFFRLRQQKAWLLTDLEHC